MKPQFLIILLVCCNFPLSVLCYGCVSFCFSEISTDRELTHSILDVEDLVKFGNKKRCDMFLISFKMIGSITFLD